MDLAKKLEYAKTHVDSIANHNDADVRMREAALVQLKTHVDAQVVAAHQRVTDSINAAFGEGSAPAE